MNQTDFDYDPDEKPKEDSEETTKEVEKRDLTAGTKTVFEKIPARPQDKRKRVRKNNPEDIEGFLGPWGGFVDEVKVAKPDEVCLHYISYTVSMVYCLICLFETQRYGFLVQSFYFAYYYIGSSVG